METQHLGTGRANALKRGELKATVRELCGAPPASVYDVLADLRTHAIWGGERQRERTRILRIDAPDGPATVGTEFETVGADVMGRFTDRSVVTEATRPSTFEFVTEALLTTKKGRTSAWTVVHRYELTPAPGGSEIAYTARVTRISDLIGPMKLFVVPGLSVLAVRSAAAAERRGARSLSRFVEERAAR